MALFLCHPVFLLTENKAIRPPAAVIFETRRMSNVMLS